METVLADIRTRLADLPDLYPGTASAHASVKRRGGRDVARRWRGARGFARFLEDMGPRPHNGLTVDRIDTDNPNYGPGLCRWADAGEQANNRTTGEDVYDPREGVWASRADVARRHGLNPDNVRQAMRRGASAAHVIQTLLNRRAARPSITSTGRTAAAERPQDAQEAEALAQAEAQASGEAETIPPQPVHLALDPVERRPWPLTLAQRELWEARFLSGRAFFPHGFEWRFEHAFRTVRAEFVRLRDACNVMVEGWGGEPNEAEEAAFVRLDDRRAYLENRLMEADPRIAEWKADMGQRRRDGAPGDLARMVENEGRDFFRLSDDAAWRTSKRDEWESAAAVRRMASATGSHAPARARSRLEREALPRNPLSAIKLRARNPAWRKPMPPEPEEPAEAAPDRAWPRQRRPIR